MNSKWRKSMIAYCFASIQGYGKIVLIQAMVVLQIGTFVYTETQVKFLILIKGSTSGNREWFIFDNKRDVIN